MSYGEILEQGSHSELMQRKGHYAALVEAQNLGSNADKPDFDKEEADADAERQQSLTLQPTKTSTRAAATEEDIDHLTSGTMNYSLIRCITIMLREQKSLYGHFAIVFFSCLIGGGTYPAQALIFSRLIRVFTLPRQEARNQADFFSLMFFIVAIANLYAYASLGWFSNKVCRLFNDFEACEMANSVFRLRKRLLIDTVTRCCKESLDLTRPSSIGPRTLLVL